MTVCLVTGGAGFIGSHLVDALVARGHQVRVLDNLSTGNLENLEEVRSRIDLIIADMTDFKALQEATKGVELVFHQAALDPVPRSLPDILATHQTCATGTLLLLLASRDAGVKRLIYGACAGVYGNSKKQPKSESDPLRPLSLYAIAKLTGEYYCDAFRQIYGLETVRLRYFSVFGPRQSPLSPYAAVVPLFLQALLEGRNPVIYGDGTQSRDFTYVGDVVQANLLAAETNRVSGKVYNIAFGSRTTLRDLVRYGNDLLGTDIPPIHTPPLRGEVRHSQADTSRAQVELGYCPSTDVKQGLQHCIAYYQAKKKKKVSIQPIERNEPVGLLA